MQTPALRTSKQDKQETCFLAAVRQLKKDTRVKQIVFKLFKKKITALFKFTRDTAERIRGHRMDMTNTTFI